MVSTPSASPTAIAHVGFGAADQRSKQRRRRSSSSSRSSHSNDAEANQEATDFDSRKTISPRLANRKSKSASAIKQPTGDDLTAAVGDGRGMVKKLSVAALIRSFSPRSRAKHDADSDTGAANKVTSEPKQETKAPTPTTFGKLKRSSLSFPAASPRKSKASEQPTQRGSTNGTLPATTTTSVAAASSKAPSPASVSKWKQAVQSVAKDAARLKIQIPPTPSSSIPSPSLSLPAQNERRPSGSTSSGVAHREFSTGPGSFVDDVRTALAKLLAMLDSVDPRKLTSIRLGGELRGLLGKAQDEFAAYEDAFRDHAASVGVFIALQNFAASLRQVFPIVERLQTAKFLLNRQFKRDVTFAFQEINSYYTSMFMELSMAVAQRAGVVLPMPSPVKPTATIAEEDEPDDTMVEPPSKFPPEPTGDELCLAAHTKFFGHGCQVNWSDALELYKQAAAKNCVTAMRCVGHMYMQGEGVEKDTFVAEKWLAQAASAGDAEAYYLLGCLYSDKAPHQKTPQLTRELFTQALHYWTLAAERGLADAQYRLAALLESGESDDGDRVEADDRIRRATPWYRRAAEQRHAKAEAALGRILLQQYDADAVVAMSEKEHNQATEAIHWLQRAAASAEDAEALTLLGLIFSSGRRGIKRDLQRGMALLRRAVAVGSHDAMLHLATLLLVAGGSHAGNEDREETHDDALRLLLMAAQHSSDGGGAEANFQIGELLFNSSLLRDRAAALRFFVRAAQSRPPHAGAAKRAATMVYSGIGCKAVDKKEAYRLYTIAADAGDAAALNALGLMNEDGEGCDLDFRKAAECYRRAVELGSAHAHFNLGCLLAHGKGVARNLDAAEAHFHKAASLGYSLALEFIRSDA